MFPLSSTMELTQATTLGLALVIGLGFGFFLEKAGFGSTRKLAAVFYFYDMAVVKVMFTAIVTAMIGIFLFSSAGARGLAARHEDLHAHLPRVSEGGHRGRVHGAAEGLAGHGDGGAAHAEGLHPVGVLEVPVGREGGGGNGEPGQRECPGKA